MNVAAPFRAAGEHVAIDLGPATALFTTRRGGVSQGTYRSLNLGRWTEDAPAHVRANRARVAAQVGLPRECFVQGRQVHGAAVRRVHDRPDPGAEPEPADGQATARPGVAALVLTADCLPIAVAGDGAVAMLHAGWRGLAGGVIAEGVTALRELGARGSLTAAIGPGAGGCCYEVGEEMLATFPDDEDARRPNRRLDLKAIAARRLAQSGVEAVHDVGLCTMCSSPDLFFSHRRDGATTGRQAGIAWRS